MKARELSFREFYFEFESYQARIKKHAVFTLSIIPTLLRFKFSFLNSYRAKVYAFSIFRHACEWNVFPNL